MAFVFRSFYLVFFLFALASTPLFSDEFDDLAHDFSEQVHVGIGVLPKLPDTTKPFQRQGDIEQTVLIESRSHFLLRIRFSLLNEVGKLSQATIEHRFSFHDLSPGGRCRVEVNHKLMTLSIQDTQHVWSLGFRSSTELTKAASLFTQLIARSDATSKEEQKLSTIARKNGYKALALCPKQQGIKEIADQMLHPQIKDDYIAWLTKNTFEEEKALLEEGENSLPLFLYDLERLDGSEFYTVSYPLEHEFQWYTIEGRQNQSIESSDFTSLKCGLERGTITYIHFTKLPPLTSPIALLCHPEESRALPKLLKTKGFTYSSLTEVEPLFWEGRIPLGTNSVWLTPAYLHADDTLRYWFEKGNSRSLRYLFSAFIKTYPNAKMLLRQKSAFLDHGTVLDAIQKSFTLLHISPIQIPKEARKVLKIALTCHEMGSDFGPPEECAYNSYPFAQMLAEKLGCSEQEQNMLEHLLKAPLLQEKGKTDLKQLLMQEASFARVNGLPPSFWIPLRASFAHILFALQEDGPNSTAMTELVRRYPKQTLEALCLGTPPQQGLLPTRRLYSSYIWEARDPLHRDGLHLKRLREKYEQQILHTPQSPWKGKFWQWLETKLQEKPLTPAKYLKENERSGYCPLIREGKLYTQQGLPILSKEIMFVIDAHRNLYVEEKKDGAGPNDLSFNHASFLSGGPVASSGKITLDAEGKPVLLRNSSGHYRPKIQESAIALQVFQEKGIDIHSITVAFLSDSIDQLPSMDGTRFLQLFHESMCPKK